MLSKLAAAVIAVSLIAGPALAQNPGSTNAPTATHQRTADAGMTGVKKVSHFKRHAAKAHKHVTHVKFVKHVKHLKQVKRFNHAAKHKTAG